MLNDAAFKVSALDLWPQGPPSLRELEAGLEGEAGGAVVAGTLVSFGPGVSETHRRDVLQSLLLAQLAANARAERHKQPGEWFSAYRGVLEQVAWVVESSIATTRYRSGVTRFSVSNIANDMFRHRVGPEELRLVLATLDAVRAGEHGAAQLVFECPSHSGGIGNFQVALAIEEEGELQLFVTQVSFSAPQHVVRLLSEEFTSSAQFQVAFLALTQNQAQYEKVRAAVAAKVESRFAGSVAILELA